MKKIYVLHENDDWTDPLIEQLRIRGLAYESWHLARGHFDLLATPPEGVFYNRMSASSHTRDHRFSPEYCGCVLEWLELHGRRVINGRRALQLEVSKIHQYVALQNAGIGVPRTAAALGKPELVAAAADFDLPFITKHNRAGRGLGVRLFETIQALTDYTASEEYPPSVDGVTLIQQYIAAPRPFITRLEFVGRKFLYAVRVDTSDGFELCPCDTEACEIPPVPRFEIIEFEAPTLIAQLQQLMKEHDIHVAAFEMIEDGDGKRYIYDINTNTNYNSAAEKQAGASAMGTLAEYLGKELAQL